MKLFRRDPVSWTKIGVAIVLVLWLGTLAAIIRRCT